MVAFTKLEDQFTRICFHYFIGDSRESELVKALVKRNPRGDAHNDYVIFCKTQISGLEPFTIGTSVFFVTDIECFLSFTKFS